MNKDVFDRRGIEGVRFTHPLRHEALPTGLRDDPVMCRAQVLLSRRDDHPLARQRVIRILNCNFIKVMMGSIQCRRSVVRSRFSNIWLSTLIDRQSAIIACSTSATDK